jgi:hypothetical protein
LVRCRFPPASPTSSATPGSGLPECIHDRIGITGWHPYRENRGFTKHFDPPAAMDDKGRAFVDTETHEPRIPAQCAGQPWLALAGEEVLVGDGAGKEPESFTQSRLGVASRNHCTRHDRGAG